MSLDNNLFSHSKLLFGIKPVNISSDMLEDWLFLLAAENHEKKQACTRTVSSGQFKHGVSAELIFRLCCGLKQPCEVKYHAVELFDRFMTKHLDDLQAYVQNNFSKECRDYEWQRIIERVKMQLVLRMLSCIQITSKLYCNNESLCIGEILFILQKYGHPFQFKSVLNSELRVLDVVNYQLNATTPLVYVEVILEILGRNDPCVNVKALYDSSLDVLDVFYLHCFEIYEKLFRRITGKSSIDSTDVNKFNSVKNDTMFMASSAIACSAYIIQQCSFFEVSKQLQFITRIPFEEITELAVVVIGEILEHEEGQI